MFIFKSNHKHLCRSIAALFSQIADLIFSVLFFIIQLICDVIDPQAIDIIIKVLIFALVDNFRQVGYIGFKLAGKKVQ